MEHSLILSEIKYQKLEVQVNFSFFMDTTILLRRPKDYAKGGKKCCSCNSHELWRIGIICLKTQQQHKASEEKKKTLKLLLKTDEYHILCSQDILSQRIYFFQPSYNSQLWPSHSWGEAMLHVHLSLICPWKLPTTNMQPLEHPAFPSQP